MTTCLIDAPLEEASLVTFKDGPTGRILTLRLAESPSRPLKGRGPGRPDVARMGYRTEGLLPEGPRCLTLLLADDCGRDLGTGTLGSGESGLRPEESYSEEIATLRNQGRTLCEFNALAILPGQGSATSLARLFHAALLAGGPLLGNTDGVVEVNPVMSHFMNGCSDSNGWERSDPVPELKRPLFYCHSILPKLWNREKKRLENLSIIVFGAFSHSRLKKT